MYHLDNNSGVAARPDIPAVKSAQTRWFTEGGNGVPPSYPGAHWFNIIQAELLGVLTAAGIEPNKAQLNQLATAIKKIAETSPQLTGTPTAPTPAQTANDTTIATTEFVKTAIAALVGSAPAALDTLAEIAAALGADGNLKATLLAAIGEKATQADFVTLKNLLIGIPMPYPLSAVPSGCLAFNGQAFNKATYPILAQKYPSGVLPDLRGEFIRGWDNGRGVDSSRVLLSSQGDLIKSHTHNINIAVAPQGSTYIDKLGWGLSGADRVAVKMNTPDVQYATPGNLVVSSGGSETRPRNIAFQYICLAA